MLASRSASEAGRLSAERRLRDARRREDRMRRENREMELRRENEKREMRLEFGERSQEKEKEKSGEFRALLAQRATTHSLEVQKLEATIAQLNDTLESTHARHKETLAEKFAGEARIAQLASNLEAREDYLGETKADLAAARAQLKKTEEKCFQVRGGRRRRRGGGRKEGRKEGRRKIDRRRNFIPFASPIHQIIYLRDNKFHVSVSFT